MFTFCNSYVFVTSTLCAATFSNSYVKWRLRYVMLRFVALPFCMLWVLAPPKANTAITATCVTSLLVFILALWQIEGLPILVQGVYDAILFLFFFQRLSLSHGKLEILLYMRHQWLKNNLDSPQKNSVRARWENE